MGRAVIEMRLTGEMNPEGGARWYASETCFRLYSLLMTNGQEKEGRHEKCPYVDVKYVVSGTKPKSLLAHIWRWHTGWCPGWKSYIKEREAEQTPSPTSPTDS